MSSESYSSSSDSDSSTDARPSRSSYNENKKNDQKKDSGAAPVFVQSKQTSQPINAQPINPTEKVSKDFAAFTKHSNIGMSLMMKMGYKHGTGLGTTKSGIINPIDVKLRPTRMGLGHKGFDERTDAVIAKEARVNPKPTTLKKTKEKEDDGSLWDKIDGGYRRKEKKRTLDDLATEQEEFKKETIIVDMTGRVHQSDPEEIVQPVITDAAYYAMLEKTRLLKIKKARLANLKESEKGFRASEVEMRKSVLRYTRLVGLLKELQATVDSESLEMLDRTLTSIKREFMDIYWDLDLDTIVVASIQPTIKQAFRTWDIYDNPSLFANFFTKWRPLLINPSQFEYSQADIMSPYETLIYTLWAPKNMADNSPAAIITCIQSYAQNDLLPIWMHAQLLDQLIVPRLNRQIEQHTTSSIPLHYLIFPWLPLLQSKSTLVLEQIKYKLSEMMRGWSMLDKGMCDVIGVWRDVIKGKHFESIITLSILPKLKTILDAVVINPSNQDMNAIQSVLKWKSVISDVHMAKLLNAAFFPKWINILRQWLETRAYPDIAQWYRCWKLEFSGLQCNGFLQALDIMNAHLSGVVLRDESFNHVKIDMNARSLLIAKKTSVKLLTFKETVEAYCSDHSVMLLVQNRIHVQGRAKHVVYRLVSDDGKKTHVYLDDGVVFFEQGQDKWIASSIQSVVSKLK